jgi:toxin ParE1/3/4
MTGRLTLSPRAQLDIDEIWDYTANRWGIDQAETYVRRLGQHMTLIARQPELGNLCPEIRTGYHRFPCEAHILFYRVVEGDVEVVRILHSQMDFVRHL